MDSQYKLHFQQVSQEYSFDKFYNANYVELNTFYNPADFNPRDLINQKQLKTSIQKELIIQISNENPRQNNQERVLNSQQSQFNCVSPKTNKIEESSKDIEQITKNLLQQLENSRLQTQNLGKHLKVITISILEILRDLKVLSSKEAVSVLKFKNSNGSIKDFNDLMLHQNIRSRSLQYFSSSQFVKKILQSAKMSMKNKIMLIKYLQKQRSITYTIKNRWKSNKF